ncbi:NAD(P)/FAD-dependent oxidoreductase [Rhodococcus erythropolis]|uniref:NAD(P)/FAD-dependent oxidoreductase n=1 Tax=Rhodococcus erythropolis TaxID=1833 RepID=UPI00379226DF
MSVSTEQRRQVVVVGAGHAGGTLAGVLRQQGFDGTVIVVGAESDPPYHRPPLSKKFAAEDEPQWLRPLEFYSDNNIELRLSETVVRIDRAGHVVHTAGGDRIDYDTLVIATGASARSLPIPGNDLRGVVSLRTLGEAQELRDGVVRGASIAIVGGGYIGLEVAAAARAKGCDVVILEREDRVLARVASSEFSSIVTEFHRTRGTRILTEVTVSEIRGKADGSVESLVLADGTEIGCDLVLVGVGAIPNDKLARDAGIACESGITVDGASRTSDPFVLAIGDVTHRIHDRVDGRVRLESIPSAVEQARQAAAVIVGSDVLAHEVPWFWSDQFDLKMKMAGILTPGTEAVLRGDPSTEKFALFHLEPDGTLDSLETVNAAAEFMAGKRYLANRTRLDRQKLVDLGTSMRDVTLAESATVVST